MTILSVNKTTEQDGRSALIFCGHDCACFLFWGVFMKKSRFVAHGALVAALYVALTYLQNALIPGSTAWAIQFRASETLCVLALFTPAAIPGLTLGCMLFNISFAAALPLDFLVGSLATLLATGGMYALRKATVKSYPLLAMLLPAVTNGFLVGWELTVYIGGAFWLNTLYVAIGELTVLLTLGTALYYAIRTRNLDKRLFG